MKSHWFKYLWKTAHPNQRMKHKTERKMKDNVSIPVLYVYFGFISWPFSYWIEHIDLFNWQEICRSQCLCLCHCLFFFLFIAVVVLVLLIFIIFVVVVIYYSRYFFISSDSLWPSILLNGNGSVARYFRRNKNETNFHGIIIMLL